MAHNYAGQYKYRDEYKFGNIVFNAMFPLDVVTRVKDFLFKDSDIVIATYPKAGTTWVQAIVYELTHFTEFAEETNKKALETPKLLELKLPDSPEPDMDILAASTTQRNIKTHMYYENVATNLERTKAKTILVIRDPRDTLVSYFHFCRAMPMPHFEGVWADYFELYKMDRILAGNFFDFYFSWGKSMNRNTVHLVRYEDLKADPHTFIGKIAEFLGVGLTADNIAKVVERTSMKSMRMKGDDPLNKRIKSFSKSAEADKFNFFRKGISGDWKNHFTVAQAEEFEAMNAERNKELEPGMQYDLHI